jgi:hypothetical protein
MIRNLAAPLQSDCACTALVMHAFCSLDKLKSDLGSEIFAVQYQQRPISPSGTIIKPEWVRRHEGLPIRSSSSYILQSWDLAIKAEAERSFRCASRCSFTSVNIIT